MRVKTVPSEWLRRESKRLDSGPYTSGALEAKVRLESLAARKDRLKDLTTGHNGGLYNGPKFSRTWVDGPEHGVPFVGSGDMLKADLTALPFLRRKDATSSRLSYLRLAPQMTLISCSGTIGRMVYSRPDMDGIWSSQHIMKVVPDSEKVPPGYIYAYLSSKFGVPLVVSGTYGSIIQSIEPQHIADLPVPRLGDAVEQRAHELVEEAARKRTEAARLLSQATEQLIESLALGRVKPDAEHQSPHISMVQSKLTQSRMDGFYYCDINQEARSGFDQASCPLRPLKEVAEVFIPGIFKRRYADDPRFGHPYITGADVFQLAPTSDKYLMKRVAAEYQLVLKAGMILIQEAGQLGGLIGRSVPVGDYLDGFACTNNMVRVTPRETEDAGYIFAVLASPHGVRLIARESAGSSIPHIEVSRVRNLMIPWADQATRKRIGGPVIRARELRDEACTHDVEARALVERTIEEAS